MSQYIQPPTANILDLVVIICIRNEIVNGTYGQRELSENAPVTNKQGQL